MHIWNNNTKTHIRKKKGFQLLKQCEIWKLMQINDKFFNLWSVNKILHVQSSHDEIYCYLKCIFLLCFWRLPK
jgi:hypothetical protein